MFVRYFVELSLPVASVEAALLGRAGGWLPGVVAEASDHGERLLGRIGGAEPFAVADRRVEVELGRAVRFPSKLAVPISWRAADGSHPLPALDAEIEVGMLGPDHTQLAINGRYTTPPGMDGRVADRLLMHRVTEAIMKRFLDEVARRLLLDPTAAAPEGGAADAATGNGRVAGSWRAPQGRPL